MQLKKDCKNFSKKRLQWGLSKTVHQCLNSKKDIAQTEETLEERLK